MCFINSDIKAQTYWNFDVYSNKQFWEISSDERQILLTRFDFIPPRDTADMTIAVWNADPDKNIYLNRDFIIKFRANFGEKDTIGADGIAFTMFQKEITGKKYDEHGGCLGYTHPLVGNRSSLFRPCFTIEFDTYYNENYSNDSIYDHIQYVKNGNMHLSNNYYTPVPIKIQGQTPLNIEDGEYHCIVITWESSVKRLRTYVDGVQRHSYAFVNYTDLIDNLNSENPVQWIITAATGDKSNDQRIIFDYINTYTLTDSSTISDCPCPCYPKQVFENIKLVPDGGDSTKCCYKLLMINHLTCPWIFKELSGHISEAVTFGYNPISNFGGFTFQEEQGWIRTVYDSYSLKWTHQKDTLEFEDTLVVGTICIPRNGKSYRFDFWDHSDGIDSIGDVTCKYSIYLKCDYEPNIICCNKINVTVEDDGSQPNSCCYYVYIKDTTGCVPSYFDVFDFDANGNIYSKRANKIQYILGIPGDPRGKRFGPFCMLATGRDSVLIELYFVNGNDTTVCSKLLQYKCPVKTCCDSTSITINQTGLWDNGIFCCFNMNIEIDSTVACDSLRVLVKEAATGGRILWPNTEDNIISGTKQITLCLNSIDFYGYPSVLVKIEFRNLNGELVCTKTDSLTLCSGLPSICTPDSLGTPWQLGSGHLQFSCPGPPPKTCNIRYNYAYRHVKDGAGNSIHRDVQVLTWVSDCDCEQWRIANQMLKDIWETDKVLNNFEIDDYEIPPGDTICFTNFRAVNSDCGRHMRYVDFYGISYIYQTCGDTICCYGGYRVCYGLNSDDPPQLFVDSYTRLDYQPPVYEQCIPRTPPCYPGNCFLWSPPEMEEPNDLWDSLFTIGFGNRMPDFDANLLKSNENCEITVTSDIHSEMLNVRLVCRENGFISIGIYDLLGTEIYKWNFEKKSLESKASYNINLSNGIYIVVVKLQNNIIKYHKMNFIK